jgi:hypothetical protein
MAKTPAFACVDPVQKEAFAAKSVRHLDHPQPHSVSRDKRPAKE